MNSRGRKRASKRLSSYSGPYPYRMLDDARFTLMRAIDMKDTVLWSRIRAKTGIYDNGERDVIQNGFGEKSTYYSHADLTEENLLEGEYYPRVSPPSSTIPESNTTNTTTDIGLNSPTPETSSEINCKFGESSSSFQFQFSETEKNTRGKQNIEKGKLIDAPVTRNTSNVNIKTSPEEGEIIEIDETDEEVVDISDQPENDVVLDPVVDPNSIIVIGDDTSTRHASLKHREKRLKGFINDSSEPILIDELDESDGHDDSVIIIDPLEPSNTTPLEKKNSQFQNDKLKKEDFGGQTRTESGKPSKKEQCTESSVYEHSAKKVPSYKCAYKCDFCDYRCETTSLMRSHLKKSGHFSASKVKRNTENGDYVIEAKLAVMMKGNLYKTMVSVCPDPACDKLFKTTYACALHHRLQHDNMGKLSYGLAEVIDKQEFPNPHFSRLCPVCGVEWGRKSGRNKTQSHKVQKYKNKWYLWLLEHYQLANHYPFHFGEGCCHFLCTVCDKNFNDLYEAHIHHVQHKNKKKFLKHDSNLVVLQTGKVKVMELPTEINRSDSLKQIEWNTTRDMVTGQCNDHELSGDIPFAPGPTQKLESAEEDKDHVDKLFVIDRNPMKVSQSNSNTQDINLKLAASSNTEGINSVDEDSAQESKPALMNTYKPRLDSNLDLAGKKMFFCDFCNRVDKNRAVMYEHLSKDSHSSASTVQVDNDAKPMILFEKMSVQNYRATYRQRVAACPIEGCPMIFPDIYQCSMHCKVFHKNNKNIYGVSEVKLFLELEVNETLTCNVCKETFTSAFNFRTHLKETKHREQEHDQFVPSEDRNVHFMCPYCEILIDTYFKAISHLREKHCFKAINKQFMIKVIFTDRLVKQLNLLPFSSDLAAEIQNIDSNLAVINEMRKSGGSQHKKMLHKEKNKLKKVKKKLTEKIHSS